MIPAEVALKVVTSPTIPWELYQHLYNYKEDRDPKVKDMLKRAKTWAVMAACKGLSTDGSLLVHSLPPVTLPSSALKKQPKRG